MILRYRARGGEQRKGNGEEGLGIWREGKGGCLEYMEKLEGWRGGGAVFHRDSGHRDYVVGKGGELRVLRRVDDEQGKLSRFPTVVEWESVLEGF